MNKIKIFANHQLSHSPSHKKFNNLSHQIKIKTKKITCKLDSPLPTSKIRLKMKGIKNIKKLKKSKSKTKKKRPIKYNDCSKMHIIPTYKNHYYRLDGPFTIIFFLTNFLQTSGLSITLSI